MSKEQVLGSGCCKESRGIRFGHRLCNRPYSGDAYPSGVFSRICPGTVSWGAGPRASINLVVAAKVRAAINGRYHVGVEDIRSVLHPILRHRIITNFTAQAKGLSSDDIITQIIEATLCTWPIFLMRDDSTVLDADCIDAATLEEVVD